MGEARQPIGLIAGGGAFPLLFARAARERGRTVFAVAHRSETSAAIDADADRVLWVKLGQLGRIIRFFHENGVRETVFCGHITKTRIFKDALPDLRALSLWRRIDKRQDDAILRAVAAELEGEGIQVLASTCYLEHLFFPAGVLGRHRPTPEQMEDVVLGRDMARAVGRLDIGQCVVVRDRVVVAVEAIEGTDATIRRAGKLAGNGLVVVKVKKPDQDFRFDLPATGAGTIAAMAEAGGAVLAVEAGQSLIFDRQDMVRAADRAGIAVVGFDEQGRVPGL